MFRMHLVLKAVSVFVVLLMCACSDEIETPGVDASSPNEDTGSTTPEVDASSPNEDTGSTTPESDASINDVGIEEPSSAQVSGKLHDGMSVASGGFRVNLCSGVCLTVLVEADGAYSIAEAEPTTHLIEVWPLVTGPHADVSLAPMFPITLTSGEDRSLDLLWLAPDRHADLPINAAEVEIAEGLFVTIGENTARPSLFLSGEFTEVYGVRFLDAELPPFEGVSEPLAFWVLGPTDTESMGDGFPVRFTNTWSLPDGTTLQVWHAELDTDSFEGVWAWDGEVTVMGDEIKGAAKLSKLGSILLSK